MASAPWPVMQTMGEVYVLEGYARPTPEVFYGKDWSGWDVEQFMREIDAYLRWHNERRIKLTLDGLSPVEYRTSLGLMAA